MVLLGVSKPVKYGHHPEFRSSREIPKFCIRDLTNKMAQMSTTLKRPKVFVGSASEGLLQPGDKVVGINHQDASRLTHLEAQNLIKKSGTSAKLDILRPGVQAAAPGPYAAPQHRHGFFSPIDGMEVVDREYEVAKVHSQPYRTRQLIFPGAKPSAGTTAALSPKSPPKYFQANKSHLAAAQFVSEAISQKQPFRTTPLVSPTPKTINDVTASHHVAAHKMLPTTAAHKMGVKPPPLLHQEPSYHQQQVKNVNIGGTQKQIVSHQFNSPLNMYSDDAIADAAMSNQSFMQASVPTLGQIQQHYHPGFVPSSKPHLPTPKDATYSRPQQSETFKIILESEMDKARDHQSMSSSEFHKQTHMDRPTSSMSNRSNPDPLLMDKSINQSASFKKIMYSVLGEAEL